LRALCHPRGRRIIRDLIRANLPLSARDWELVPKRCPGIGALLGDVISRCLPCELDHVVKRMPRTDVQSLRAFLLAMHRLRVSHDLTLRLLSCLFV
jgi:hypothetical protein